MLCKSSFNHSILFFVTGITYATGILIISINEKGGLMLTLCASAQSVNEHRHVEFEP